MILSGRSFNLALKCSYRSKFFRTLSTSASLLQSSMGNKNYKPTNLDKRFLVWTNKKYKSMEDVPEVISNEEMDRARNRMRIRVANIFMLCTVLGCILMIISGKNARARGESVQKYNVDWHKKYNEELKKASDEESKKTEKK